MKLRHLSWIESFDLTKRAIKDHIKSSFWLQQTYGDRVHARLPFDALYLFHPSDVHYVLKDNASHYIKNKQYQTLGGILGKGLVTSEGQLWVNQRRTVGAEFHTERVNSFFPHMKKELKLLTEKWDKAADNGDAVNASKDMLDVALGILGGTLFKNDLQRDTEVIGESLVEAMEYSVQLSFKPYLAWFPNKAKTKANQATSRINKLVDNMINLSKNANDSSVLSRLLKANSTSHEQIRDEVKTLIFAGHETSALALSWTLYLLCSNPKIRNIVSESVRSKNLEDLNLADLKSISEVQNVINESLRLYSPVPVVGREAAQDTQVADMEIKKGQTIMIVPTVSHRHPGLWERPNEFVPDRFSKPIEKYAFFPFLYGRRSCIGEEFANLEMLTVLTGILQRYDFEAVNLDPDPARPLNTLRMKSDLFLKVSKSTHMRR